MMQLARQKNTRDAMVGLVGGRYGVDNSQRKFNEYEVLGDNIDAPKIDAPPCFFYAVNISLSDGQLICPVLFLHIYVSCRRLFLSKLTPIATSSGPSLFP